MACVHYVLYYDVLSQTGKDLRTKMHILYTVDTDRLIDDRYDMYVMIMICIFLHFQRMKRSQIQSMICMYRL
jgi:hypothetical protein